MQDTTQLNPIHFINFDVVTIHSVFVEKQDSLDNDNCSVCGIMKARDFYLYCTSFCMSIDIKRELEKNTVVFTTKEETIELNWIEQELNRVKLEISRVKRASSLLREEKREKVTELINRRAELLSISELS